MDAPLKKLIITSQLFVWLWVLLLNNLLILRTIKIVAPTVQAVCDKARLGPFGYRTLETKRPYASSITFKIF